MLHQDLKRTLCCSNRVAFARNTILWVTASLKPRRGPAFVKKRRLRRNEICVEVNSNKWPARSHRDLTAHWREPIQGPLQHQKGWDLQGALQDCLWEDCLVPSLSCLGASKPKFKAQGIERILSASFWSYMPLADDRLLNSETVWTISGFGYKTVWYQ